MKSYTLIDNQDASITITSVELGLGDLDKFSIHANFTGVTLAGTLSLECSNDNTDWVMVENSDQVVASAASHMWNVSGASYQYVRVKWVPTGGTGNLTCKATVKENLVKPQ